MDIVDLFTEYPFLSKLYGSEDSFLHEISILGKNKYGEVIYKSEIVDEGTCYSQSFILLMYDDNKFLYNRLTGKPNIWDSGGDIEYSEVYKIIAKEN